MFVTESNKVQSDNGVIGNIQLHVLAVKAGLNIKQS